MVNGLLRNVERSRDRIHYPLLQENPVKAISIQYSHPSWLVEKWLNQFGIGETISLCKADNAPPPFTIRTNTLKITREKLIELAILVGTDYNPGGIKGIGPKKALEIVKYSKDPLAKYQKMSDVDLYAIKEFFLNPPVTDEYKLEWKMPDEEGILKFLCDEHDFSEERVKNGLERLKKAVKAGRQFTLDSWFKK